MRKIIWEKWEPEPSPLGKLEDLISSNTDSAENEFYEDLMDEGDSNSVSIPVMSYNMTPIGPYLWGDPSCPSKMFDCWIIHTNFDITKSVIKKVSKALGVEIAHVMTRYRMFIGFSPAFNFRKCRVRLEEILCKNEKSTKQEDSV